MFDNKKIRQLRKDILDASYKAGACHIGSALSCVEILYTLFYKIMGKGDRFIFSKASGAATYYAILADKGYFPKSKLPYYLKNYPLPSKEVPGVLHSTGSLGMGLSVAVGLALADRTRRVFCLVSDGELEEGNTWEALHSSSILELNNLKIIIDYNKITACHRIDINNFFRGYSRHPGHSVDAMKDAIETRALIIASTKKGKGIPFMEDSPAWHYRNLNEKSYKEALKWI